MKQKKIIKQLMAVGISRNEAVDFTRAYRKIVAAKKTALFPELMMAPMPEIQASQHQIQRLKANSLIDPYMREMVSEEDLGKYVKSKLKETMMKALDTNGVLRMEMRQEQNGYLHARMYLDVVMH